MLALERERITFFGGKGGVGKTTCSVAYAVALAQRGYQTLLVSTDPAHSLGDLLELKTAAEPVHVTAHLWVQEIDPEKVSQQYIEEVKQNMKGLAAPGVLREAERQMDFALASPGADEAALFDAMVSVILAAESDYDRIVFDTAPTGHTLRLLTLPELMGVWVEGMLSRRKKTQELHRMFQHVSRGSEEPKDRVYELLERRKNRYTSARKRLLNPKITSFYFVLNPERLSILESEKAMKLLKKYGVPVSGILVNRVIPDDADGTFLAGRRAIENGYLQEIEKRFAKLSRTVIPLYPDEIRGLNGVERVAKVLEADGFGTLQEMGRKNLGTGPGF
ncbi:ArsA family ATPase [Melghirimyces algeriensis]|uniref:Arsenite efflux ATP-binding protein ArsA n=1 Tax=Melghirimyces algeriensis TaxID=910412 RepID=A0A521EJD2_9BACL|nr:ArsA family ATPase [Melghirimyces algeriensis]SMO84014.1 arsenite efflux ATP-binding protein ArsA [Melghirimyces algeriensis]